MSSVANGLGLGASSRGQQFHPLSRVPQFSASELRMSATTERSMGSESETGDGPLSVQSSDSDRILRLCQGSRSNMMMEVGQMEGMGGRGTDVGRMEAGKSSSPPSCSRDSGGGGGGGGSSSPSGRDGDSRRGSGKSVRSGRGLGERSGSWHRKHSSSSGNGSDDEIDRSKSLSDNNRRSKDKLETTSNRRRRGGTGRRNDANRFSLTQLDKSKAGGRGGRGGGGRDAGSRFAMSFTQPPAKNYTRRSSFEETPPNFMVEMNNSKNWDSMDILRDAAAEANGEGPLDALVEGLLHAAIPPRPNVGEAAKPQTTTTAMAAASPPPPSRKRGTNKPTRRTSSPSSKYEADPAAEEQQGVASDAEEADDAVVASVLSRGPSSAHEEAALASAITQRRASTRAQSSFEGVKGGGAGICGGGIGAKAWRGPSSVRDIPAILRAVRARPTDEKCTERAFQSIFLLATDPEPEGALARREILAKGGMEVLVSAIWDHMQNGRVLLALFHALWAISALDAEDEDEDEDESSASKIRECGVLEGLLFAMQSHAADPSIQDSGCDLITRLTGLLPKGTPEFKSAVVLLSNNVKAIRAHRDARAYSSCLDALNGLCQLSDENKRAFAKAKNDCHGTIIRSIAGGDDDDDDDDDGSAGPGLEAQELACQLFWCVTSDRVAVSSLSSTCELLLSRKIIDALKTVPRARSSADFYGAACGTLANLALETNNHSKMIDLGVVPLLCEAIYVFDFSADVNSAACTALANLSASKEFRKSIAAQGGMPALFSAMKSSEDSANVQSEAFRALHNLCELSAEKQVIAANLEIIISAFFYHEGVKYIQQITCSILCRLSGDDKCRKSMILFPRTFDALAKIMKSNKKKKLVLKAACSTLRNLSTEKAIIPKLFGKGFDSLVINAMDTYGDCEEIQQCACTFLMNMGSNSPEASVKICSGEGINCIVKSMQTLPTSVPVQEASCGALHAITKGDAHKNLAISAGAVDAVIYLMLVHPDEIKVLENAVNVLVNLSSLRKCTKTIANAGAISTVIETMRSNRTSAGLVLRGSRFMQNMALSRREYAAEALGGITPILACMEKHPNDAKLVEESCKALRCLVLKSETCKDRLINADGVAVIEKTMEENSTSQRWQTLLLDELFQ